MTTNGAEGRRLSLGKNHVLPQEGASLRRVQAIGDVQLYPPRVSRETDRGQDTGLVAARAQKIGTAGVAVVAAAIAEDGIHVQLEKVRVKC